MLSQLYQKIQVHVQSRNHDATIPNTCIFFLLFKRGFHRKMKPTYLKSMIFFSRIYYFDNRHRQSGSIFEIHDSALDSR